MSRGYLVISPVARAPARAEVWLSPDGVAARDKAEAAILAELGDREPITPRLKKALRAMEWGQTKKLRGLVDHALSLLTLRHDLRIGFDLMERGLVEANHSGDLPVDFVLTPAGIVTKGRLIRAEYGPAPAAEPRVEAEAKQYEEHSPNP